MGVKLTQKGTGLSWSSGDQKKSAGAEKKTQTSTPVANSWQSTSGGVKITPIAQQSATTAPNQQPSGDDLSPLALDLIDAAADAGWKRAKDVETATKINYEDYATPVKGPFGMTIGWTQTPEQKAAYDEAVAHQKEQRRAANEAAAGTAAAAAMLKYGGKSGWDIVGDMQRENYWWNASKADINGALANAGTTALAALENAFDQYGQYPLQMAAQAGEFIGDVFNTVTGQPLVPIEERESYALRQSSPFAEDVQTAKDKVGNVGDMVIDTAGAAGNMFAAHQFWSAAFGAAGLNETPAAAESTGTTLNETTTLSGRLASTKAGDLVGRLGADIAASPGNFGVSISSAANSYNQALANGASFDQAFVNGLAHGLAEYYSNKLFSGTPYEDAAEKGYVTQLTEYVADKIGKSGALKAFNESTGGMAFLWFFDKAGEGFEEVVTGILDPIIDYITYNPDADWRPKADELIKEFLGGMLLSGMMEGVQGVERGTMTMLGDVQSGGNIQQSMAQPAVIAEGQTYAPGTTARSYADALANKVKNGTPATARELGELARVTDAERRATIDALNELGRALGSARSDGLEEWQLERLLHNDQALSMLGLSPEDLTGKQKERRAAVRSAIMEYIGGSEESAADAAESSAQGDENAVGEGTDTTPTEKAAEALKTASTEASVNSEKSASESTKARVKTDAQTQRLIDQRKELAEIAKADGMGARARDSIAMNYDGSVDSAKYYEAYSAFYNAGVQSAETTALEKQYAGVIAPSVMAAAYETGNYERKKATSEERAKQPFKKAGVPDADDYAYLVANYGQKNADKVVAYAKLFGTEVRFVDLVNGGLANASIDTKGGTGRIVLMERGNKNPLLSILGHEWTHRMQLLSEDAYNEFKDAIKDRVGERVQRIMANYKSKGLSITAEEALDEAVADYAGAMLIDGKTIDAFIAANKNKPTLLQRFRDWIRSAIAWMRGEEKKAADEAEKKLTAAIKAAAEAAEKQAAEDAVTVVGDNVVVADNVAEILTEDPSPFDDMSPEQLSIKTEPDWARYYLEYGGGDAERIVKVLNEYVERITANDAVYNYVPTGDIQTKTPNGPLRPNTQYQLTFDLDASCPRSFQFLYYRNQLQKIAGRPLTYNESIQLIELMRAYGQNIPCTYCYVENKRILLAASYNNWFGFYAAVKGAATDEEARKLMYGYNEKTGTLTDAGEKVMAMWRSGDLSYRPTASDVWIATQTARNSVFNFLDAEMEAGRVGAKTSVGKLGSIACERFGVTDKDAVKEVGKIAESWLYDVQAETKHDYPMDNDRSEATVDQRALAVHAEAMRYANSASSAHGVDNYEPYTNQLMKIAEEIKQEIIAHGGLRKHSSNDFRLDYLVDYLQLFADMAAGKWTGHTYTKNVDYVKIFGRTGDRINMSIAMMDVNGKVVENEHEGMGWADAKKLRADYADAGVMAMVTSDAQLSFALNADWIDMIIPFHASGLKKEVWYNIRNWFDYSSKQNERWLTTPQMRDALKARHVPVPKQLTKSQLISMLEAHGETANENAVTVEQLRARLTELGETLPPTVRDVYEKTFGVKKVFNKDGVRVKPYFLPGDFELNGQIIPGHNNDAATYLRLCREYGVNPRFLGTKVTDANGREIDITEHPNYVKVLKETSITDREQQPIQFNFDQPDPALGMTPLEYGFQRMEQEAANGGYGNLAEDKYGIVQEFAEHYLGKDVPLPTELDAEGNPLPGAADKMLTPRARRFKAALAYRRGEISEEQLMTVLESIEAGEQLSLKDDAETSERIAEENKAVGERSIEAAPFQFSVKDGSGDVRIPTGTFFSGAGTVNYALQAVISSRMDVEFNGDIANVFRLNNGDILVDDVRNVDVSRIGRGVEYFHASPVCKDYSRMNRHRGQKADSARDITTAQATADAIETMLPKVFTLEQVPDYNGSRALKIITDTLDRLGYTYDIGVYNAYDYGGATSRERLLLRAVKSGELPPLPAKVKGQTWYEATKDMIDDLPDFHVQPFLQERLDRTKGIDYSQPVLVLGGTNGGLAWYAEADKPCPSITTSVDSAVILMPDGRVKRATPSFFAEIFGLHDFKLNQDKGNRVTQETAYTVVANGVPAQLTQKIFGNLLADQFGTRQYSLKSDEDYLAAVERGDMETAQRMVDEAAKKAGYFGKGYHQTAADFTRFSTEYEAAGKYDDEMPTGFFIKPTSKAIGVKGAKQMPLFFRASNMLTFASREQARQFWIDNVPGYKEQYEANLAKDKELERQYDELDKEWDRIYRENYDGDLDAALSDIDRRQDEFLRYWNDTMQPLRRQLKDLITDYIRNSDYDGIHLLKDAGGIGKGTVETYELFSPEQLKSAEPVVRDDNGEIIKPSERFNPEKTDIRWSMKEQGEEDDIATLISQNRSLQEAVEYWRGETKRSGAFPRAEMRDVKAVAKSLIADYQSTVPASAIEGGIRDLAEALFSPSYTPETARSIATDVIRKVMKSSSELSEGPSVEMWASIRAALTTPMKISQGASSTLAADGTWRSWRTAHGKSVNVSINGKTSRTVGEAYSELSQSYPDLFPADIADEAEQVLKMLDVADTLTPIIEDNYSTDLAYAIEYGANDLIQSVLESVGYHETYADKAAARVQEARETERERGRERLAEQKAADRERLERRVQAEREHTKERVAAVRAQKNARIAEIQRRNVAHTQALLQRVRAQRDARIADIMQHNREMRERQRERRELRADQERLLKVARRLERTKSIPEHMDWIKFALGDLDTAAINITGKTILKLTEKKERVLSLTDIMSPDYDADYILTEATKKELARLDKTPIASLTHDEVLFLTRTLQFVEARIALYKKAVKSQLTMAFHEAGVVTVQDVDNTIRGKLDEKLSPTRAADRIVGYRDGSPLSVLMRETVKGEGRADLYKREALLHGGFATLLTDKQFLKDSFGKDAKPITIYGTDVRTGKPVALRITQMMRVALYLHSLNDDNFRHIRDGGILIPDFDQYVKGKTEEAYNDGVIIKMSRPKLAEISHKMTAKERQFAEALQWYYNVYAPKYLNEASIDLDGWAKFTTKDYYPIRVDADFLSQDVEAMLQAGDPSLARPGWGEERKQSAMSIVLYDASSEFNRMLQQNAAYAFQAIPLHNLNRLINVNVADGESVKKAIGRAFSDGSAMKYLKQYMADYAGRGKQADPKLQKIMSNYAGAVLVMSAGTAFKQFSSYPAAANILRADSLLRAFNAKASPDLSFIDEMTAVFTKRKDGFTNMEYSGLSGDSGTIPKALNWIQGVDVFTTWMLKRATYFDVIATNPELEIGSREFKEEVVDRYERVIRETQPNYSTALRPGLLRSQSDLKRALAMFATQPLQYYNILYDSINRYQAKAKQALNTDPDTDEGKAARAEKDAAKRQLAKSVGSVVASTLLFAVLGYAFKRLTGKDKRYKDKDGNPDMLAWLMGIGLDVAMSTAGMWPILGKALVEVIEYTTDQILKKHGKDAFFEQSFYGLDVASVSAVSDAIKSTANAVAALTDVKDDPETAVRQSVKAAEDVLMLFGIPLKNVENDLMIIARPVMYATYGKPIGQYYVMRLQSDPASGKSEFYRYLYNLKQTDYKAYNELYKIMCDDDAYASASKTSQENIDAAIKKYEKGG